MCAFAKQGVSDLFCVYYFYFLLSRNTRSAASEMGVHCSSCLSHFYGTVGINGLRVCPLIQTKAVKSTKR